MQALGPLTGFLGHNLLDQCGRVDQVEALALDHLQGDRVVAVEARGGLAILKRQIDLRQIAQRHHPVAIGLDRQIVDIAHGVEGRRDLDRKGALIRLDLARGNQLVVVLHNTDQLACGDVIGLKPQGIDRDLDHLVPAADERGFQNRIKRLQIILQLVGIAGNCTLRHRAGQVHDDDGEFGKVELVDRILFEAAGKFGLGLVHRVAHIGEDLGLVPAELELQHDIGVPFGGGGCHLVQPVQIGKLGFHWLDQQVLCIGRGNAGEGQRDHQRRDLDVGLTLLGQADIGECPHRKRQEDKGKHHPRARRGPVDNTGHCVCS